MGIGTGIASLPASHGLTIGDTGSNDQILQAYNTTANTQTYEILGFSTASGRAALWSFVDNSDGVSGYTCLFIEGDTCSAAFGTGGGIQAKKGGAVAVPGGALTIGGPSTNNQEIIINPSNGSYSTIDCDKTGAGTALPCAIMGKGSTGLGAMPATASVILNARSHSGRRRNTHVSRKLTKNLAGKLLKIDRRGIRGRGPGFCAFNPAVEIGRAREAELSLHC